MAQPDFSELLRKRVQQALEGAVMDVQEEEIKEACRRFEHNLRKTISSAAIEVSHFYSVETRGAQVIITIKDEREAVSNG